MERAPTPMHALLMWVTCVLATSTIGVVVIGGVVAQRVAGGAASEAALAELEQGLRDPTWLALSTLANEAVLLGVFFGLSALLKVRRSEVLPLARPTSGGMIGCLLVVYGAAPFASAIGEMVRRALGGDSAVLEAITGAAKSASSGGLMLLFFSIAVMPGIAEEAVFRGFIHRAFVRISPAVAVAVSSVLFALVHLDPIQVAGTLLLGVAFGLGRYYTGSIVPSIVAHAVYNASVLLYVRLASNPTATEIELVPLAVGGVIGTVGVLVLRSDRARRGADSGTVDETA